MSRNILQIEIVFIIWIIICSIIQKYCLLLCDCLLAEFFHFG